MCKIIEDTVDMFVSGLWVIYSINASFSPSTLLYRMREE